MVSPILVDLFTYNKNLEDLLISEYSGAIFPEQHKVDATDKPKLYCFYDLDLGILDDFLRKLDRYFEYEIRDSRTGEMLDYYH